MYLLVLLVLILFSLVIFTAIQFFNILFRHSPPFISTKPKIIEKILTELDCKLDEKIYELGCGKADLSFALEKKFPKAQITAIEYSFLPFAMAKYKALIRNSKIKLLKQNILKVNLDDANLIYLYLGPPMMEKLAKKIKTECRRDTKIISYRFTLPGAIPEQIIETQAGKIYFYNNL